MKFAALYGSFEAFYASFLRGNELEFLYKEKQYYIIPYVDKERILGVLFGEAFSETPKICRKKEELYNMCLEGEALGEILSDIDIIWYNV